MCVFAPASFFCSVLSLRPKHEAGGEGRGASHCEAAPLWEGGGGPMRSRFVFSVFCLFVVVVVVSAYFFNSGMALEVGRVKV